jgi:hypothetical protein
MSSSSQFRLIFSVAVILGLAGAAYSQNSTSPAPAAPGLASTSPKVTYVNGQLTISAQDASLGDVLRAVSVKTGAVIEFPADRAQEHLFANAGPGPVREVLAVLLNGSRFNYVMLASPTNPNILQRMILTSSEEPASPVSLNTPVQAAAQPPVVAGPPAQELAKGLPPAAAAESAAIEAMDAKDVSPDDVAAMLKARREARKQQREQENPSGSTQ